VTGPFVFDVVVIARAVAKNVLDSHPEIKLDSTTLATCLEEFIGINGKARRFNYREGHRES